MITEQDLQDVRERLDQLIHLVVQEGAQHARCGKSFIKFDPDKFTIVVSRATCPECLRLNKEEWMKYLFDKTPKIDPESPEPRGTLTIT